MKILFLGGTQFVGRHMVDAALKGGHQVTLFNRGKTNAELFPQAEKIRGDRDGGLEVLQGRTWDAVIDVNGYVPRLVRDAAQMLKNAVNHYIFVSTGSVYDFRQMKAYADESSPLEKLEDVTTEEWMGPAYGGLKVLCEQAVQELFPDKHMILRLGVVAGPYDPTDRITYWVTRVAHGGEMLVPGGPDWPVQFIDARDLAGFTMLGIDQSLHGVYNTIGNSISWQHFLDSARLASGSDAVYTWIADQQFLSENINLEARMFGVLPMTVPVEFADLWTMKSDRALADGMVYRSCLNTARDVLAWDRTRPINEQRVAGLAADEELKALEKWHQRNSEE